MPIRFGGAGNEWALVAGLPLLKDFVTARKACLSPSTGCDKNGEGSGERMKVKERQRRALSSWLSWPVSYESFDVRHDVIEDRGFSFLCANVWCSVLREFSMR